MTAMWIARHNDLARREGESYAQDANVAAVSYGKPLCAHLRLESIHGPPAGERCRRERTSLHPITGVWL